MANWINKILYKKDQVQDEVYDIGTTFDKVRLAETDTFTLYKLYDFIKSFFKRPMFMLYSTLEPLEGSKIVQWYKIEITSNNDILDNNLTNYLSEVTESRPH